jgi:hypothetical protein
MVYLQKQSLLVGKEKNANAARKNSEQDALVEKGASIRHICLEPNSIRDQWVHQSRFI